MSHERLAQVIQAQQDARVADPEARATHECILSILHALDVGEITQAQARRLCYQAVLVADEPTHAALYRQAAADIGQMQREAQEKSALASDSPSQGG